VDAIVNFLKDNNSHNKHLNEIKNRLKNGIKGEKLRQSPRMKHSEIISAFYKERNTSFATSKQVNCK
jgi:hypothetical protein